MPSKASNVQPEPKPEDNTSSCSDELDANTNRLEDRQPHNQKLNTLASTSGDESCDEQEYSGWQRQRKRTWESDFLWSDLNRKLGLNIPESIYKNIEICWTDFGCIMVVFTLHQYVQEAYKIANDGEADKYKIAEAKRDFKQKTREVGSNYIDFSRNQYSSTEFILLDKLRIYADFLIGNMLKLYSSQEEKAKYSITTYISRIRYYLKTVFNIYKLTLNRRNMPSCLKEKFYQLLIVEYKSYLNELMLHLRWASKGSISIDATYSDIVLVGEIEDIVERNRTYKPKLARYCSFKLAALDKPYAEISLTGRFKASSKNKKTRAYSILENAISLLAFELIHGFEYGFVELSDSDVTKLENALACTSTSLSRRSRALCDEVLLNFDSSLDMLQSELYKIVNNKCHDPRIKQTLDTLDQDLCLVLKISYIHARIKKLKIEPKSKRHVNLLINSIYSMLEVYEVYYNTFAGPEIKSIIPSVAVREEICELVIVCATWALIEFKIRCERHIQSDDDLDAIWYGYAEKFHKSAKDKPLRMRMYRALCVELRRELQDRGYI